MKSQVNGSQFTWFVFCHSRPTGSWGFPYHWTLPHLTRQDNLASGYFDIAMENGPWLDMIHDESPSFQEVILHSHVESPEGHC